MSIMHCDHCSTNWDSDFHDECPFCEGHPDEPNPLKEYAFELALADLMKAADEYLKLIEARSLNALSDNFAYTNGSDEAFRKAIAKAADRRNALEGAVAHFE